jgi:hypothetical protein
MKTVPAKPGMSKLLSVGLVAGGAVLALAGVDSTPSFAPAVAHFFSSWPVDRAIWMVIVGLAAMAFGLTGAWRARDRLE